MYDHDEELKIKAKNLTLVTFWDFCGPFDSPGVKSKSHDLKLSYLRYQSLYRMLNLIQNLFRLYN